MYSYKFRAVSLGVREINLKLLHAKKCLVSEKVGQQVYSWKCSTKLKTLNLSLKLNSNIFMGEVEEGCLVWILCWINAVPSGDDTCRFSNPRSFDLLLRKLFAFLREIEASLFIYFNVIVSLLRKFLSRLCLCFYALLLEVEVNLLLYGN